MFDIFVPQVCEIPGNVVKIVQQQNAEHYAARIEKRREISEQIVKWLFDLPEGDLVPQFNFEMLVKRLSYSSFEVREGERVHILPANRATNYLYWFATDGRFARA